MQRQQGGGEGQGVLGVVGAEDHGIALCRQTAHHLQYPQLVAVVQRRGGLVHHQHLRLLRQRTGDQHQLLLAAGEMGEVPLPQMGRAHLLQRLVRLPYLGRARLLEGVQLTGRAHQHRVQHRVAEGGRVDLGDVGDASGPLTGRQGREILTVHFYVPHLGR